MKEWCYEFSTKVNMSKLCFIKSKSESWGLWSSHDQVCVWALLVCSLSIVCILHDLRKENNMILTLLKCCLVVMWSWCVCHTHINTHRCFLLLCVLSDFPLLCTFPLPPSVFFFFFNHWNKWLCVEAVLLFVHRGILWAWAALVSMTTHSSVYRLLTI